MLFQALAVNPQAIARGFRGRQRYPAKRNRGMLPSGYFAAREVSPIPPPILVSR